MSRNLGCERIELLMLCLGLKIFVLKSRDIRWWSKSSVGISAEILQFDTCSNRESEIKKNLYETCWVARSLAGRRSPGGPGGGL